MLTGLRNATNNWLGKAVLFVLFGLLIISFAIWGIGDIFRGGAQTTVATVGRQTIDVETLRRAFQNRVLEIQRQVRGFNNEQARQLGLDRQVLARLLGEAALDQEAARLGLGFGERAVAESLVNNPGLRGPNGAFNRDIFNNLLRELGMNEAQFLREQNRATQRQFLIAGLVGGVAAPEMLLQALDRYGTERRSAATLLVPAMSPAALDPPSAEALAAFYQTRKGSFRTPERRSFTMLAVLPADFADRITISETELRAAYDRLVAAGQLGQPERRRVRQIVFPTAEEAHAARERLDGSFTFDRLAEERQLAPADIDLGLKARGELLDPAIAEAAFGLLLDEVSMPIPGTFGTALVEVSAIEPGNTPDLEAVRELVLASVRAERLTRDEGVRRAKDALFDRVETLRAEGKPLAEVAAALGRTVTRIEGMDANGRDPAGQPVALGIPDGSDAADLRRAVFASDVGVDNETLRTRDNGYVWFEITRVEASRERTLDEVRTELDAAFRAEEVGRQAEAQARALLARLEKGESLEALAAEIGGTVERVNGIGRETTDGPLSPTAIASIFAGRPGSHGVARARTGQDRVIFTVLSIDAPAEPEPGPARDRFRQQIHEAFREDMLGQTVNAIQTRLGSSVNARALAIATGAANP